MSPDAQHQIDRRVSPSKRVIDEVAEQKDIDPTTLPPLHRAIDPDALDALFAPTSQTDRMKGAVSFKYSGYEVTVYSHGYVETTAINQ